MRIKIVVSSLAFAIAAQAGAQTAGQFTLSSKEVAPGKQIPLAQVFGGMGCTGKNVSPSLNWHGAPEATRSFAVTMYDPDAPTGSGWWHWVVYNIPGNVSALVAGAGDAAKKLLPPGSAQGNTDFGAPGYGGPCPPAGDKPHHYVFTVYALKPTRSTYPRAPRRHTSGSTSTRTSVAKATFTALYGR